MKFFIHSLLLTSFFLINKNKCSAQSAAIDYVQVRFVQVYDYGNSRYYFTLNAEWGSDSAKSLYTLLKYDAKRNGNNTGGRLYHVTGFPADRLYNYFLSPTEGLNYMSRKGWQLIDIYTEAHSGYDNQRTGAGEIVPITTVGSKPVYCFRKQ